MDYTNTETPPFYFVDGPPFVSSETLHYGHILVSSVKSAILHYKHMKGYTIQNTIGYDCHGLPIEMKVNELLGLSTNKDIEEYGIENYTTKCKEFIQKCQTSWTPIYRGIGRVVDEQNVYRTVDESFMRIVWRVFKQLWDKGYITRGKRVIPYSIGCTSSLSNFEASQNYKEVSDPAVYYRFPVDNSENEYLIIWTTTPWTLPANQAVCVGGSIDYVLVELEGSNYWMAKECLERFLSLRKQTTIPAPLDTLTGKELSTKTYSNSKRILVDDYVSTSTGSGIVHLAPEFGEDDMRIFQKNTLTPVFDYINDSGIIQRGKYKGEKVLETTKMILIDEKGKDILVKENYKHSYPYCWRTDTPLIYRAMDSFFVNVSTFKDKLVEYNKTVRWVPEHVGSRRFHEWLDNARDWGISRNRIFGTPIPVWTTEDDVPEEEKYICVEESEVQGDLHRDSVDSKVLERNGHIYKRIPDVFDCWFESGCVPFALGEKQADLIVEGLDQTRGWFYTLMVLWGALKEEAPYKEVVTCGLVLAEDGKKMSKRLQNYKDVKDLLKEHGADPLRLYLLNSVATHGESFKFSEKEMVKTIQQLTPYKNAIVFWKQFGKGRKDFTVDCKLDSWILYELNTVVKDVSNCLENYKVKEGVSKVLSFVDTLCNKYLRFMRDAIRENGSGILYTVLRTYTKLLVPFVPFLATNKDLDLENPLAEAWPCFTEDSSHWEEVERMFSLIDEIRKMRDKEKLSLRKPIAKVCIPGTPLTQEEYLQILQAETNVMELEWNSTTLTLVKEETPEILKEYTKRLIKREIYNLRKEVGLTKGDKVYYKISGDKFLSFLEENKEFRDEIFEDSDTLGERQFSKEKQLTIEGVNDGIVGIYV
jgi:isoleucyl-tRNA synthetase